MSLDRTQFDAVVIGAGLFGVVLANHLITRPGFSNVAVIEIEESPLQRASARNQARIHQGYHYPRSLATAEACRRNYTNFTKTWPSAVFTGFRHLYGIARYGSKVSSEQFAATMRAVGAPLRELASRERSQIFDPHRIEDAYEVFEQAFDYRELALWAKDILSKPRIESFFGQQAISVRTTSYNDELLTECQSGLKLRSRYVFNLTYGGLSGIEGIGHELESEISFELTEMNLVKVHEEISGLAITVMDGPFFSLMPYPALETLRTLSHVRYTPLVRVSGHQPKSLYKALDDLNSKSYSFEEMRRDASRYVPALEKSKLEGTIREVKTVLTRSSYDDSRPILFVKHKDPRIFSILGGKIDNVFDMISRLEQESLT